MNNYIHYSKPDTKAGELMKECRPLVRYTDEIGKHSMSDFWGCLQYSKVRHVAPACVIVVFLVIAVSFFI